MQKVYKWFVVRSFKMHAPGRGPGGVINYTRGVLEPDFAALKRIATFFEVRIDDLLYYHGAPDT